MVIFTPEHVQMIVEGRKTQTRRVVKSGEELRQWEVGRTYAVQPGRGKPAAARIRITSIRQERLRDISEDDVVAEGHNLVRWASEGPEGWPATAEYAATWDRINTRKGTRWADNPLVWVLDFEVVR